MTATLGLTLGLTLGTDPRLNNHAVTEQHQNRVVIVITEEFNERLIPHLVIFSPLSGVQGMVSQQITRV